MTTSPRPTNPRYRFLEPAALQELKNLRFIAKRIVEGSFAGRHRSNIRGSSVEFADYREYSPGDDLRRLDWKVYLRTRRPYIRTFDEETNLTVLLAVDTSRSMDFGGRESRGARGAALTKLNYARYLAAALAYLVVQSRDQAGLALVANDLAGWHAPGSTHRHLDGLLNLLERAEVGKSTRLGAGLESLFTLVRRRGILILVSDFLDENLDDLFRMVRLYRHRRFEVILFHVIHPEEQALPYGRNFRFVDSEGGGELEVDPRDVEQGYAAAFEAHRLRVRNLALGCGCEYEPVETGVTYPDAIRAYLRVREAFAR
ncbi:MAG: DUF58 domain-containing protein [Planctomycetota bacterium]|nr:DUF58 domain-containing protein [Planctomycetota bacterium]